MISYFNDFEFLFWTAVFMVFYAYLGYPLSLYILSKFNNKAVKKNNFYPKISFIITAYNEQEKIANKLENTLSLDYPSSLLEIIVASDCSSDRTDEIVKEYEDRGVKLVRAKVRGGKEHAQKLAVQGARGDILVFSDVSTILESDALKNIVSNFADSSVGCVSSVDKFINPDGSISGEGVYVRYEMFLRSLESKVNTLVGLSGSFFAARKSVCQDWASDLQSDFNTVLNSVKKGLRGISDSASIGYYKNIVDEKKEFNRKVRTVLRGISVFMRNFNLLNPFRYGLFSWQLFSHKLCRWLVPMFLILAFISNAVLAMSSFFYFALFLLQVVFYSTSLFYYLIKLSSNTSKTRSNKQVKERTKAVQNYLKLPYYFVIVNASILVAWTKYFKGERATFWEPSKR